MLNTNYCIPDKKYSRKHVYIVYFWYTVSLERRKKRKNTAINAALTTVHMYIYTYKKLP